MAPPSLSLLRLAAAAALAAAVALLLPRAAEPRSLFSLDDFGAVGDGVADDTKAFVDAWNAACAAFDHSILSVPAGKTYQVWPVTLFGPCRDNIKLLIAGNIVAPEDPAEWRAGDSERWLHFYRVEDLSITGGGVVDGRGQQWWTQPCHRKHHADANGNDDEPCIPEPAPRALHFEGCHGVSVQGITLQNSPQHHLAVTRSSNVRVNYLRVTSPEHSPGTNGIHLTDAYNVHVMDSLISTGGDCIAMVGNCTDVRVRSVSCGSGDGIRIGTLGDSPAVDKIQKIKIETVFISNSTNGLRIKTWQDGCGFARKVNFESIMMKNVSNPITIDQYHTSKSNDRPPCKTPKMNSVAVEKIDYIDVSGTTASKHVMRFACSDAVPCRRITLKNVNLTRMGGRRATTECRKASGKSMGVVVPESCLDREEYVRLAAGDDGGEGPGSWW